mmetsp:Transcript_2908/g.5043  ORF Transcript_2908/g.5043 Transcript_2908/m.5043 type:complete len:225 (-) Transcript_2908:728-1402(-)
MECGPAIIICKANVCPEAEDRFTQLPISEPGGIMQRALAIFILTVHSRSEQQEGRADFPVTIRGRQMQCRAVLHTAFSIHHRACLQQQLADHRVTLLRSQMQGSQATLICRIDVTSVGDHVLDAFAVPVSGGQLQWCGAVQIRLVQSRATLQQALLQLRRISCLCSILQSLVEALGTGGLSTRYTLRVRPDVALLSHVSVKEIVVGSSVRPCIVCSIRLAGGCW